LANVEDTHRSHGFQHLAMEARGSTPTVLDVVENALGARPTDDQMRKLSLNELSDLRERLSELWEAQSDQKTAGDSYLVGDWVHAYWSEPTMRQALSDSLLYYSQILVLDPLADFFGDQSSLPEMRPIRYRRNDGQCDSLSRGPKFWSAHGFDGMQQSSRDAAASVARIVSNLYALEAPIREGILVLRSQWPTLRQRAQQIATSVRHDIKSPDMQRLARVLSTSAADALPVWDNLRGGQVSLAGPVHPADDPWQPEPEFFYLAKTLAVADAAGAQYIPSTESDLQFLKAKVNTGLARQHPGGLLREVSRILVPSVDVPIERAVEMRQSSQDFEDWRSSLNELRRSSAADSSAELREHVEDILRPRARAVERELQRTSPSASFRAAGAELAITGAVGMVSAGVTGEGYISVGAGLGAGALTWLTRAYTRDRPGGADAVLATLIKKH
jgi:hypothetical protein